MKSDHVTILGMGYVGLTLAVALAERDFIITGVDNNKQIVKNLNDGNPHFYERKLPFLLKEHLGKNLSISDELPVSKQDVFIIAVGTPTDTETRKPNLQYITHSLEQVVDHLDNCPLVMIRSTVPIGSTRNVFKPLLDRTQKKYYLAFCPERTAEGNALDELYTLPQIIGGIDEDSTEIASRLFSRLTNTIVRVSSLETAEATKLVCNCYRDVQFALANEIALLSGAVGLNPHEVIHASNMGYSRSNIQKPGFVGGACLDKDPYILFDSLQRYNFDPKLLRYSRQLNEHLPLLTAENIVRKLHDMQKSTSSKIFISGFAFKGHPETNDMRGSPTLSLLRHLQSHGYSSILGHDFVVPQKEIEQLGIPSVSLDVGFSGADCVILANNNIKYQHAGIEGMIDTMKKPALFVDIWGFFEKTFIEKKSQVIYGGIGI